MKHKKLILVLVVVGMVSMIGLTSCATYAGISKDIPYSISYNHDDLVYGDIISYEKKATAVDKKYDSLESFKSLTVAEALTKYPGFDFLLFPKYEIKITDYSCVVKVTGRLAKVKTDF